MVMKDEEEGEGEESHFGRRAAENYGFLPDPRSNHDEEEE